MKDSLNAAACESDETSLEAIADQTARASAFATRSVGRIRRITSQMKMLALNAKIEAAKAGSFGRGFMVVANEVGIVGDEIDTIAQDMQGDLSRRLSMLDGHVRTLDRQTTGQRLIDIAYTAINTIDRNLFERTCDVRWWATESAFVAAATTPDPATLAFARRRLATLLDAYTIYLDLWICDTRGTILANARDARFGVIGRSVQDLPWFRQALSLPTGDGYVAGDVVKSRYLNEAQVISYAAPIRENGDPDGKVLGVLATSLDWDSQAGSVVRQMRIDPGLSRRGLRVLLVDRDGLVIAASDDVGVLRERIAIPAGLDPQAGWYRTGSELIGYHTTDGFETYRGLGWRGVVIQPQG